MQRTFPSKSEANYAKTHFLEVFQTLKKLVSAEEFKYNNYQEGEVFKVEIYVNETAIHHLDCVLLLFRIFSELYMLDFEIQPHFYPSN